MMTGQSASPCGASTVRIGRRGWLRAALAMAAASQLPGSGAANWAVGDDAALAQAKRNIKLGIHTGPYMALPVAEAVARIKDQGFVGVLTEYTFADAQFNPLAPDWSAVDKIVRCFERHGIEIAASFGYVNVVDPIKERRERGEARMACLIQNWKRLGCGNISTETGTFNTTSDWADAPENTTEEGYVRCREALEKLARMAEKAGAVVSIEPYWRNIIDSIDRTQRLFQDIQSPGLRLVMDPCNFPRKEELPQLGSMLDDMFQRLGDKIVVAHAKDVAATEDGTDTPAAGRGVLDYPHYLRLLGQLGRPIHLLLEHAQLDDVPRARDHVLAALG